MKTIYDITDTSGLITPQLVYYKDMMEANVRTAIEMAGGPKRLWPHIKSHKCPAVVKMQMNMGITKFKCATIAEAEMAADCGATDIIVAYPLVGPNIDRFIRLMHKYPTQNIYAIGDDLEQLTLLSSAAAKAGRSALCLLDINMGMDRTGVQLDKAEQLYLACTALPGLTMKGCHCYDGNNHESDPAARAAFAAKIGPVLAAMRQNIESRGMECGIFVMGGSPSFPAYLPAEGTYLSPGTIFLNDGGYSAAFPDLKFPPAAVVATRVISHPAPGKFTTDLGYKAIAADPVLRGRIVGGDDYEPILQNEEHWVFAVHNGAPVPPIGTVLYVIPTHICPTSALYPSIPVVVNGKIADTYEVAARNRKITI